MLYKKRPRLFAGFFLLVLFVPVRKEHLQRLDIAASELEMSIIQQQQGFEGK
jgi:hypothetical protein